VAELKVTEISPARLYDLRRRVLREANPDANVANLRDDEAESLHVAGLLEDRVVSSASYYQTPSPDHERALAYQMRYVATDFDVQSRGFGRLVLAFAEDELRRRGAEIVWANARDRALRFYRREGWHVVEGTEHLSAETQLAHTRIFKDLRSSNDDRAIH